MAIFGHFHDILPGSYRAKNPEKPQNRGFSLKGGQNPGPRGSPGGGFTSTPRAGAPRFPGEGSGPPAPAGVGERPPGRLRRPRVPWDPSDPLREPRGPGARGWCKTPLARDAGTGSRTPPGPGGLWEGSPSPGGGVPDPGSGDLPGPGSRGSSRTGSGDLPEASGASPGPPA